MNLQDMTEIKALELSEKIYVVLIEKKDGNFTIAKDPGMGRPWSSRNRRLAIDTADEFQKHAGIRKAAAMTLGEAITFIESHLPRLN
jgi:hypothetical protein